MERNANNMGMLFFVLDVVVNFRRILIYCILKVKINFLNRREYKKNQILEKIKYLLCVVCFVVMVKFSPHAKSCNDI
jgi:hypothetical protein